MPYAGNRLEAILGGVVRSELPEPIKGILKDLDALLATAEERDNDLRLAAIDASGNIEKWIDQAIHYRSKLDAYALILKS